MGSLFINECSTQANGVVMQMHLRLGGQRSPGAAHRFKRERRESVLGKCISAQFKIELCKVVPSVSSWPEGWSVSISGSPATGRRCGFRGGTRRWRGWNSQLSLHPAVSSAVGFGCCCKVPSGPHPGSRAGVSRRAGEARGTRRPRWSMTGRGC